MSCCEQGRTSNDLARTHKEMVVAMARLKKKVVEMETPVEDSKLERVPPLPPPPTQFSHIPTTPPPVGLYEMLAPGMLVGGPLPR